MVHLIRQNAPVRRRLVLLLAALILACSAVVTVNRAASAESTILGWCYHSDRHVEVSSTMWMNEYHHYNYVRHYTSWTGNHIHEFKFYFHDNFGYHQYYHYDYVQTCRKH